MSPTQLSKLSFACADVWLREKLVNGASAEAVTLQLAQGFHDLSIFRVARQIGRRHAN